jgi:hypothetical protein
MALFLIPLQLALCSRLPIFFRDHFIRAIVTLFIIMAYAMLLYLWLTRSPFASFCWLPYKSLLLD